jgi:hypothetical protein
MGILSRLFSRDPKPPAKPSPGPPAAPGPPATPAAHYSDKAELIKQLRRDGKTEEAERLLLEAVEATEEEAQREGWGVAPWYYEQLAILYKKAKRPEDELAILERHERQPGPPTTRGQKLTERLRKLRERRGPA